jgi:hypothetical protein
MVKKISTLFFAAIIVVTGIIAISKSDFMSRSARIFSVSFSEQNPGMGRERGDFEGRGRTLARQDYRRGDRPGELPDSVRAGFNGKVTPRGLRERNMSDSLRRQFEFREQFGGREGFREGSEGGGIKDGGDLRRGRNHASSKKINLGSVGWYLSIFAFFTLLAVYTDRTLSLVMKKKNN